MVRFSLLVIMAIGLVFGSGVPAGAVGLTANESLNDGVLNATPDNIVGKLPEPATYSWADKLGDGSNVPAAAGLNMVTYDLTRSGNANGFVLNLNDGTSNGAITWIGPAGGSITTAWGDNNTGPITIQGVTDITCKGIYTNPAGWKNAGAISVTQTGSFLAQEVRSNTGYTTTNAGAISFTGGGPSAGTFQVTNRITSDRGNAGPVTISGYSSVTIGSGGISAYREGSSNTIVNDVTITNIGSGGVNLPGASILTYDTAGAGGGGSIKKGNVTISTTGPVTVASIATRAGNGTGAWLNHDAGDISITAGGNVNVTGDLDTRTWNTSTGNAQSSGDISISSTGGSVHLNNINTSNVTTLTTKRAGNATINSFFDVFIDGIIDLSLINQPSIVARRGYLSVATGGGGGGRILIGNDTGDVLDMNKVQYVRLDSESGTDYLGGSLLNFATAGSGGSGTFLDPLITTQTALRVPAGELMFYDSSVAGNAYLSGKVYVIADLSGLAGKGGLLLPPESIVVPEPAALGLLLMGLPLVIGRRRKKMARQMMVLVLAGVVAVGFAATAQAVSLTGNENLGDGTLNATPDNIVGALPEPRTFSWADKNGDGSNVPAAAGLNMLTFNLTRTADANGFVLNLNDGTSNGAITWGGVTGGSITTVGGNGPVTIQGASDITCKGIYTNATGWNPGKAISVTQSGSFSASDVLSYGVYSTNPCGLITFAGGGSGAGTFTVTNIVASGSQSPTGGAAGGAITITGYRSVNVGAGGIDARGLGASSYVPTISITSIGTGGVTVGGVITVADADGSTKNNLTINTTGPVSVGGLDTRYLGSWNSHDAGDITLRASGNIVVTGDVDTRVVMVGGEGYTQSSGDVDIMSTGGSVRLGGNLYTSNITTLGNKRAGNAIVNSFFDVFFDAAIDLSLPNQPTVVARRGYLSVTTGGGGGGRILIGNDTGDILDMNKVQYVKLDSESGMDYLGGTLQNFATASSGGSGTFFDPLITTQTALRVPDGEFLLYQYVSGGLNDYLGGKVYRLADLNGTAGQGGLLLTEIPVPEPAAFGLMLLGLPALRRRRTG